MKSVCICRMIMSAMSVTKLGLFRDVVKSNMQ